LLLRKSKKFTISKFTFLEKEEEKGIIKSYSTSINRSCGFSEGSVESNLHNAQILKPDEKPETE
jgi:hypothetical protein